MGTVEIMAESKDILKKLMVGRDWQNVDKINKDQF